MQAKVYPMATHFPSAGSDFDHRMGAVADSNSNVFAIRSCSARHLSCFLARRCPKWRSWAVSASSKEVFLRTLGRTFRSVQDVCACNEKVYRHQKAPVARVDF